MECPTAIKDTVERVMRIWAKAAMKTQLYRNCIGKLENLWMQWKNINEQETRKDDEGRKGFSGKIGSL